MSVHDQLTATGSKLPELKSTQSNYSVRYNMPSPVSDDESKHTRDNSDIDRYISPIQHSKSYPALNSIHIRDKDTIKSCCFTIDKRLTIFFCQLTVGVSLMLFCCYMLTFKDQCDQQQPFLSLLTFLVGVLLPKDSVGKVTR